MALINASYFNGEINIPNVDKQVGIGYPVLDLLNQFIEKYEPVFLKKVLGYAFYNDFMLGLQQSTVAQRWTDLLIGKEYIMLNGQPNKWRGIVEGFADVIEVLESLSSIMIQVGRGQLYDPVVNASSVTIPVAIQGKPFKIYQRGFGELADDEYTVSLDGITLTLTQWTFSGSDRYFYHAASITVSAGDDTPKYSMIANYVYYWYMRNNSTTTTDAGEKHSLAENSERSNPSLKMSRAWNEAIQWVDEMRHYLNSNRVIYPEWKSYYAACLERINAFGI